MKTKNNKLRVNNFFISNTSMLKLTISQVIYHIPQAFTTAEMEIFAFKVVCRGVYFFYLQCVLLKFTILKNG
jgi:hypothetical protein